MFALKKHPMVEGNVYSFASLINESIKGIISFDDIPIFDLKQKTQLSDEKLNEDRPSYVHPGMMSFPLMRGNFPDGRLFLLFKIKTDSNFYAAFLYQPHSGRSCPEFWTSSNGPQSGAELASGFFILTRESWPYLAKRLRHILLGKSVRKFKAAETNADFESDIQRAEKTWMGSETLGKIWLAEPILKDGGCEEKKKIANKEKIIEIDTIIKYLEEELTKFKNAKEAMLSDVDG